MTLGQASVSLRGVQSSEIAAGSQVALCSPHLMERLPPDGFGVVTEASGSFLLAETVPAGEYGLAVLMERDVGIDGEKDALAAVLAAALAQELPLLRPVVCLPNMEEDVFVGCSQRVRVRQRPLSERRDADVVRDGMADDEARRQGSVFRNRQAHELAAREVTALAEKLEPMPLRQVVEAASDPCDLVVREATY